MRDTLVLFTQARDCEDLAARINGFSKHTDGVHFQYYSCADCVFGIDDSGDVLGDYEDEERDYVKGLIGEFSTTLAEYQSMACVRTFLERVLPNLKGLLDTNYDAFITYNEALNWLSRAPDRHFREGPPPFL